jgi:hypothetical protein
MLRGSWPFQTESRHVLRFAAFAPALLTRRHHHYRFPIHLVHPEHGKLGVLDVGGEDVCPNCSTRWCSMRDNSVRSRVKDESKIALDVAFTQREHLERELAAARAAGNEAGANQCEIAIVESNCRISYIKQADPLWPRSSIKSYFMFFQKQECWAWQRVDGCENVIDRSSCSFKLYSECVADARRHGWKGKSLTSILQQKRGR